FVVSSRKLVKLRRRTDVAFANKAGAHLCGLLSGCGSTSIDALLISGFGVRELLRGIARLACERMQHADLHIERDALLLQCEQVMHQGQWRGRLRDESRPERDAHGGAVCVAP